VVDELLIDCAMFALVDTCVMVRVYFVQTIQQILVVLHGGETLVKLLVKLCKTHGKTHIPVVKLW
jgi:hypothetical protein